jgi:hypothetical protein
MWWSNLNDDCSESQRCADEAPPPATNLDTDNSNVYRNCCTRSNQQHEPKVSTVPSPQPPTIEPYVGKLERFELFSTNQCYYLVGCNKQNTAYRVLKMDRTLIERPAAATSTAPTVGSNAMNTESWSNAHSSYRSGDNASPHHQSDPHPSHRSASSLGDPRDGPHHNHHHHPLDGPGPSTSTASTADTQHVHTAKPTLRPLADFLTEDPNVYTQEEIKEMLDMIHDGNRMASRSRRQPLEQHETSSGGGGGGGGGGLQPLVKAYGIVGFIRFLDCYYLTLTTRRTKVGSIGDHGIFTIKVRARPTNYRSLFTGCLVRFVSCSIDRSSHSCDCSWQTTTPTVSHAPLVYRIPKRSHSSQRSVDQVEPSTTTRIPLRYCYPCGIVASEASASDSRIEKLPSFGTKDSIK